MEGIDLAEGFNSISGGCITVRLGFRANDDWSGVCPDSAIGFGMLHYGSGDPASVGLIGWGTVEQRFGYILGR
jgi:hypothetical protein